MKILLAVHSFLPRHVGGTEVHTDQLARCLAEKDHDVAVFTREDVPRRTRSRLKSGRLAENLQLHELHYSFFPLIPAGPSRFLRSFSDPVTTRSFSFLIKKFNPDTVHFQHLAGLSLAPLRLAVDRGIPVVVTLNDFWFICPKIKMLDRDGSTCGGPDAGRACAHCAGLAERIPAGRPVSRFTSLLNRPFQEYRYRQYISALNRADAIISPSRFLGEMHAVNGVRREIMRVIPYGISVPIRPNDGKAEPREKERQDFGITDSQVKLPHSRREKNLTGRSREFVFGYIGSIIPAKGVHLLLEAWEEIREPGLKLEVFGDETVDPVYFDGLADKKAWGRIDFRGPLERKDLGAALDRIDLLVVPSLWYENSPLVIQEAFSRGVPGIVPGQGGAAELAPEGRGGLHFIPGDAGTLGRVMRRVSRDGNLYDDLRRNIPHVNSAEEQALVIEELYLEIIARRMKVARKNGRHCQTMEPREGNTGQEQPVIGGMSEKESGHPARERGATEEILPFPFRLTVENTTSCNIECFHCLRRKGGYSHGSMNLDLFRKICRSAEYGLKEIRLSVTGEPLASTAIREEIGIIEKNRLGLALFTNGLLLDKDDLLDRILPLLNRITISVDSASPRLYEMIRKGAFFPDLERNLTALAKKRGGLPEKHRPVATMALVLMKSNYPELTRWVEFGASFDMDVLEVSRLVAHLPGLKEELVGTADPPVAAALCAAADRAAELGIEFYAPGGGDFSMEPSGSCPFIGREAWIDIEGNFLPCCYPAGIVPLGNCRETGLIDIWRSREYAAFAASVPDREPCSECFLRSDGTPALFDLSGK